MFIKESIEMNRKTDTVVEYFQRQDFHDSDLNEMLDALRLPGNFLTIEQEVEYFAKVSQTAMEETMTQGLSGYKYDIAKKLEQIAVSLATLGKKLESNVDITNNIGVLPSTCGWLTILGDRLPTLFGPHEDFNDMMKHVHSLEAFTLHYNTYVQYLEAIYASVYLPIESDMKAIENGEKGFPEDIILQDKILEHNKRVFREMESIINENPRLAARLVKTKRLLEKSMLSQSMKISKEKFLELVGQQ